MGRSQPEYEAELIVAGLAGEVEIIRDANAVPHIYAETDADAYHALYSTPDATTMETRTFGS